MIDAGCTCLGDARGNIDEGQKYELLISHKKLDNLIQISNSWGIYNKVTNDRPVFIYIVFYKHIKKIMH